MIGLALLLAAAPLPCLPVAGAAPLLANEQTTFLFVGEVHGTAETPTIFGDLVCTASQRRTVVVAIEQDTADQPAIFAYLASDGGSKARTTFLASPIWTDAFKDGRSSVAMLAMIERVRILKVSGRKVDIRAFRPPTERRPGESFDDSVNRGMAEELARIAAANPGALVMILTGSVHASKGTVSFGRGTITPAAGRLPAANTISLYADGGTGTAWNCTGPNQCGAGPWTARTTDSRGIRLKPRTLTDMPKDAGLFDGTLASGVAFTASPPAIPAPISPSAP